MTYGMVTVNFSFVLDCSKSIPAIYLSMCGNKDDSVLLEEESALRMGVYVCCLIVPRFYLQGQRTLLIHD
jgi:hypothetical protein